jgi:hypothetical protein
LIHTNIAGVIMYGNCFWHAGRVEDKGTAKSGTSVCGGKDNIGTPASLEGVTADFCLV